MSDPRDPVHLLRLLNEVGNVAYACEKHASKPGAFVGQEPASFMDRDVKLCFPSLGGGQETMWVHVERLGENGQLIGTLENEPTRPLAPNLGDLHHGDLIEFGVEEIAGVFPAS